MNTSFAKVLVIVAALSIAACEKNNGSSVPVDSSVKAAGSGSGLDEQQGGGGGGGQGGQRQQGEQGQGQQRQQQQAAQNLPLNGVWVTRPLLPGEFPVPSNLIPDGTGRERQIAIYEFNGSTATYKVNDCGDIECRPENINGEPHLKTGVIVSFKQVPEDESLVVTIAWRTCRGNITPQYDRNRGCGQETFYFRISRDGQRLIPGYLNRGIYGGIDWIRGERYAYYRAQ